MNISRILLIEDSQDDFVSITQFLSNINSNFEVFPKINDGSPSSYQSLKDTIINILRPHADNNNKVYITEKTAELVNMIQGFKPDVFIVDLFLFGKKNESQLKGDYLMEEHIKKHFSSTPIIYLTRENLAKFKRPKNSYYIYKLKEGESLTHKVQKDISRTFVEIQNDYDIDKQINEELKQY